MDDVVYRYVEVPAGPGAVPDALLPFLEGPARRARGHSVPGLCGVRYAHPETKNNNNDNSSLKRAIALTLVRVGRAARAIRSRHIERCYSVRGLRAGDSTGRAGRSHSPHLRYFLSFYLSFFLSHH